MTIDEYTSAILPLIRVVLHLKDDDETPLGRQLGYVYQQALYGYGEAGLGKKYASQAAQAKYECVGNCGKITQYSRQQQADFDPSAGSVKQLTAGMQTALISGGLWAAVGI